jgi:hypothetical protein
VASATDSALPSSAISRPRGCGGCGGSRWRRGVPRERTIAALPRAEHGAFVPNLVQVGESNNELGRAKQRLR